MKQAWAGMRMMSCYTNDTSKTFKLPNSSIDYAIQLNTNFTVGLMAMIFQRKLKSYRNDDMIQTISTVVYRSKHSTKDAVVYIVSKNCIHIWSI